MGTWVSGGHADFWVNYAYPQPGCPPSNLTGITIPHIFAKEGAGRILKCSLFLVKTGICLKSKFMLLLQFPVLIFELAIIMQSLLR